MKTRLIYLCYLLGVFLPSSGLLAQAIPVSLSINASAPGNRVNEDFVGFSMEQYTLSTGKWSNMGSFWTGGTNGNARLKNLLVNISPHSIIRLGGFTADDRMVWQNTLRGSSIRMMPISSLRSYRRSYFGTQNNHSSLCILALNMDYLGPPFHISLKLHSQLAVSFPYQGQSLLPFVNNRRRALTIRSTCLVEVASWSCGWQSDGLEDAVTAMFSNGVPNEQRSLR
jgi:hypothetical protein